MLHGIIKVPLTDLRAQPDSKSERLSQALFGAPVEIGEMIPPYCRVALPDKYAGWCRLEHVHGVSFAIWRKYVAGPKHKIRTAMAPVKDFSDRAAHPYRLYFGTELAVATSRGETSFALPASSIRGRINLRLLKAPMEKRRPTVSGRTIVATALRFIGVPYLWGGLSPMGFDCSGLVQMVFAFYGISLPRDSKDQRQEGFSVDRSELRPGDLLFFPGHVAISCGGADIVHAAASRGMVIRESLDKSAPNYREDLDQSFHFARRIPL